MSALNLHLFSLPVFCIPLEAHFDLEEDGWGECIWKEERLFLSPCCQAVRLSHSVLAPAQNLPVFPGIGTLALPDAGGLR